VPFTIPSTEPSRLTAGDTWLWTKTLALYPATEGWTLTYSLSGPSALRFDAAAAGSGYAVTVAATGTKIPEGTYRWVSYVTLAGTRHRVESGILVVEPNPATIPDGHATESFAVRTLRIVEAALESRLPQGLEEYQIAGKAVKHMSLMELMAVRAKLRHEVAAETRGGTLASLEVAFVAP